MMQSVFRSVSLGVMVSGLMLILAPSAADAQAITFTDNFKFDNNGTLFVHNCGEPVVCTGFTHVVIHGTTNKKRTLLKIHENDQGVDCVGQDSGLSYNSTYAFNQTTHNFPGGCAEGCNATQAGHWDLQAPGPGNDLRIHVVFHITFNNNGVITADFGRVNLSCGD